MLWLWINKFVTFLPDPGLWAHDQPTAEPKAALLRRSRLENSTKGRRELGPARHHLVTTHERMCVCVCVFEGTIVHVILSATWKYDLQPEVSRSFGLKKDSAAKKGPSIRKVSSRGRREPENKTTTNPNAKTA